MLWVIGMLNDFYAPLSISGLPGSILEWAEGSVWWLSLVVPNTLVNKKPMSMNYVICDILIHDMFPYTISVSMTTVHSLVHAILHYWAIVYLNPINLKPNALVHGLHQEKAMLFRNILYRIP